MSPIPFLLLGLIAYSTPSFSTPITSPSSPQPRPLPRSFIEHIAPGVSALRFPRRSIIPSGQSGKYDPESIRLDREQVAAKYAAANGYYASNLAAGLIGRSENLERRQEKEGEGSWFRRGEDGAPLDVKERRRGNAEADERRLGKRQGTTGREGLDSFFQQQNDFAYFGSAGIGTPAQTFELNFDTGSADLWVPAPSSSSRHTKFNPDASSTFQGTQTPWAIRYGSGQTEGLLASDTVTVAGLTVANHTFALANTTVDLFERLPFDGIQGMSFSAISNTRSPTFFESLIANNAVADTVFQFYLQRAFDLTSDLSGIVNGGELILGGTDSSKYTGVVTYNPVILKGYWEIQMDGIALNGTLVPNSQVRAAIDTGTSLCYLPERITRSFFDPLNGRQLDDGTYAVPCDTPDFQMSLQFGGVQHIISSDDWFLGYASDPSYCIVGIVGQDQNDPEGNPVAIIGDVFLKNVVSIFDYGGSLNSQARVGFATAIRASNTTTNVTVTQDDGSDGQQGVGVGGGGGASATRSASAYQGAPPQALTSVVVVTNTSPIGPVNTFARGAGAPGVRVGLGMGGMGAAAAGGMAMLGLLLGGALCVL